MVECQGDDLHRRTAGCCKRVDDGGAPALARLSGALLQEPTATVFHETRGRDHSDLAGSKSVEEGHTHIAPDNESC